MEKSFDELADILNGEAYQTDYRALKDTFTKRFGITGEQALQSLSEFRSSQDLLRLQHCREWLAADPS